MVWVLGMDENGLGPCLGPLVATGALLEVERYDAEALAEVGRRLGLADSKQVSAFGRMRKVESLVLAFWRERGISGDADALFEGALVGGLKPQQSPCPDALHRQQCWGAPLPLPAFGGDADEGQAILDALAQAGIRLHWLRSQLACADRIHAAQAKGDSRFQLDLMLFEEIALDAARSLGSEMHIVCGMVGGIRRYRGRFRRIDPSRIALIEEAKGRAAYRIDVRQIHAGARDRAAAPLLCRAAARLAARQRLPRPTHPRLHPRQRRSSAASRHSSDLFPALKRHRRE